MKYFFYTFLIAVVWGNIFSQTASAEQKIKVTVMYTQQYCAGAKPTKEILDQLAIPKPLANCELMFVSEINMAGKGSKVKTNSSGETFVSLKKGRYNVRLTSSKKNKTSIPYGKSCKKLLALTLATFEFDGKEITVDVKFPCDPCDEEIKKRK